MKFIGKDLAEKDEAVRLALLASVAGESIFFLGPPGTAKSLVSRRLKCAFEGEGGNPLNYFEYLMNQFSTPDELFGPVSLKALEENKYERITKGYLPDADVTFLDEIWKAGPAIQNTLLTIINEKKFHNGNQVKNVPLKALISASNELPAQDQGLEALWDRFLMRLIVNPIQSEDDFMKLICGKKVNSELEPTESMRKNLISTTELSEWQNQIDEIEVPDDVKNVITSIRQEMALRNEDKKRDEKEKFYISDRRWTKIVHVLRTSAFLNGRKAVDLMDCQLIEYCIWNTENQIAEAKEIVQTCVEQNGLEVDTAIDDINEEIKEFDKYVTEQFYKHCIEKGSPVLYKMNDGEDAYKLETAQTFNSNNLITVTYINKNHYYNEKKDSISSGYYNHSHIDTLIQADDKIKFDDYYRKHNYNTNYHHEFKIEMTQEKEYDERDPNVFKTPDLLQLRQEKADKKKYDLIKTSIDSEIEKLIAYEAEKSAPFEANLFADQKMREVILKAVHKSKVELEKAKDDLKKVRSRYL